MGLCRHVIKSKVDSKPARIWLKQVGTVADQKPQIPWEKQWLIFKTASNKLGIVLNPQHNVLYILVPSSNAQPHSASVVFCCRMSSFSISFDLEKNESAVVVTWRVVNSPSLLETAVEMTKKNSFALYVKLLFI